MRVYLWGVRGSVSVSGKEFERYGGCTSCIDVQLSSGRHLLLDGGSGLRAFGRYMAQQAEAMPPVMLFTHYHFDHIGGLPYFAPFYRQDCPLTLYGPRLNGKEQQATNLGSALEGLFDGVHFPIPKRDLPRHRINDFVPGDSFTIDGALIETAPACHLGGGVAYKITADGWTFAYTGDHEIPLSGDQGASLALADFLANSDVVLVDACYSAADHAARPGWGHSHFEQWPALLAGRNIGHVVFGHYDADYDDETIDNLVYNTRLACADQNFALHGGQQGMVLGKNGPENVSLTAECDLCDFFQQVAAYSDTHTVLGAILQKARDLTGADAGTIYLQEQNELEFASAQNDTLFPKSAANKFFYLGSRIPIDTSSIAGYVAATGKTLNIPDVYALADDLPYSFNKSFDASTGYRTHSILALPLVNGKKQIIGVLQLINRKLNGIVQPFTPNLEKHICRFGRMATIPLERALMTTDMIMRMLHTSALRDPKETAGHVWRVGSMAAELYQRWAELHQVELEEMLALKGQLRLAAMLHDVGKVAIPDAVLKKPGRLDDEERAIMQTHAAQGASLFRGSHNNIDKMALDIALHHHAKWDGSGYTGDSAIPSPAGKDIPLFARITAIVDVYDALVSSRCYKEAWDPTRALDILHKDSGTHFDGELVEIFAGIQDIIQAIFNRYREDA